MTGNSEIYLGPRPFSVLYNNNMILSYREPTKKKKKQFKLIYFLHFDRDSGSTILNELHILGTKNN